MSQENLLILFGILFAISEGLALVPALKSNSVLQLLGGIFKKLAGK